MSDDDVAEHVHKASTIDGHRGPESHIGYNMLYSVDRACEAPDRIAFGIAGPT